MFKEALKTAIAVVFSLEAAWEEISAKKNNIYKDFLIPLWTLIAVASFLGGWLVTKDGSLGLGLRNTFIEIFTLFIGFHIASYFLNEYIKKLTDVEKSLRNTQVFVAYSSSLTYLIDIVVSLINDFFFLWLFALYIFYIVYIGAGIFFKIVPERRTTFMFVATSLILGMPVIIKLCFLTLISA